MQTIFVDELRSWATEHNIEERTLHAFRHSMENYQKEEPEEYSRVFNSLRYCDLPGKINSISLKLENWPECSYNHIIARVDIWGKNNLIGYYELYFSLDGEIQDDVFVIC